MKSIMLAVLFAGGVWAADEAADRAAIEKTIGALSVAPIREDLFAVDFDGRAELARLAETPRMVETDEKPTVVISKEPWGEATIVMQGMTVRAMPVIVVNKIRFLAADVAMVDAVGRGPLLFVLKKFRTDWKIASLRILAPLPAVAAR
jgi:hypothetical protein